MRIEPRHRAAIRRVGQALIAEGQSLPEAMVSRILADVPSYETAGTDVGADVLELATATAAALNVALTRTVPITRNDVPIIGEHAARRLRQGIELDAFLHAYRVALFRYWDACAAHAAALGLPSASCLALARFALDAIDTITTHAAEAYLREDNRQRTRNGGAARDVVDRLIAGLPVDGARRRRVASRLSPTAAVQVIVAQVESSVDRAVADDLQIVAERLAVLIPGGTGAGLVVVRQDELVAITGADLDRAALGNLASTLHADHSIVVRLGLSRAAEGLVGVPRGYADAAASAAHATAAVPLIAFDDLAPMQLLLLGADPSARLAITGRAASLADDDRLAMALTIKAFADADMNVTDTAQALFVHPNTVRHRLRRIAEATGYDPRTFAGLANLRCMIDLAAG